MKNEGSENEMLREEAKRIKSDKRLCDLLLKELDRMECPLYAERIREHGLSLNMGRTAKEETNIRNNELADAKIAYLEAIACGMHEQEAFERFIMSTAKKHKVSVVGIRGTSNNAVRRLVKEKLKRREEA